MNDKLKIEQYYPTFIGSSFYQKHKEVEEELVNECLNIKNTINKGGNDWVSNNVYNTFNTYSILKNKKFESLNNWISEKILEYSKILKYKNNYKCVEAWFNVYKKYDYQEYHSHGYHSLSAVYFLKSNPEKSAKIYFNFKTDAPNIMEPDIDPTFYPTSNRVKYFSVPGELLIFKSTLSHCVEQHTDDELRISLAYNFNKI